MCAKRAEERATLYQRIIDGIMEDINNGHLKSGDKIPSEAELMHIYDVSRVTVRRAIAELTENNILEAKRGKGTYVSRAPMRKVIAESSSFTETCRKNGKHASSKVLQVAIERPDRKSMKILNLKPDDKVVFVKRVRYADGFPVLIEYNYLKPKFISLIQYDLENHSLCDILHKDFNIGPMDADLTIQISKATEEEARELNMKQGGPVLLVEELNYESNTKEIIHWTKQVLVSDGVIFQVTAYKH